MARTKRKPAAKPKARKPKRRRFSNAEVIAALQATGGNVTAAAGSLEQAATAKGQNRPCSRELLCWYINTTPAIKKAMNGIFEEVLDIAEGVVVKNMAGGDASIAQRAAEFYLMTKGKGRGYTKQTAVTGKDGGAIVFRVVEEDKDL